MNPLIRKNRSAVVITVFGKGQGKTLLSAILARYLNRKGKSSIILSSDVETPMLPVFFPRINSLRDDSLGTITDSTVIDNGIVSKRIKFAPKYQNIGVLAYAPGDNYTMYASVTERKAMDIINCAANLSTDSANYLIVDCSASVNDPFTRAAVEAADVVVYMLPPEYRGISYHQANAVTFNDAKYHESTWITVLGNIRPFHAADAFNLIVKDSTICSFPYNKNMEKTMADGDIFLAGDYMLHWHMETMRTIEKAVAEVEATKQPNEVKLTIENQTESR